MITISFAPTSCRLWNVQVVWHDCQFQIVVVAMIFLIYFWAQVNNKMKILDDVKTNHIGPPNCEPDYTKYSMPLTIWNYAML